MKKILFFALIASSLSSQHTHGISESTKMQNLEVATALLQMPILLSAATINAEVSPAGKHTLKLVTSLTRLAHRSLSLYNKSQLTTDSYNCDKYLLAWGAYDLIKCATAIKALTTKNHEHIVDVESVTGEETKLQELLKTINGPAKIALPMIEAGATLYVATNNGTSLEDQQKRTQAHSIASLARATSELLASDYASVQQKLFAAVVGINLASIYRDWFMVVSENEKPSTEDKVSKKKDSPAPAPTQKPAPTKKNVRWADENGEDLVQKIPPQRNNPAPTPTPTKKIKRKKRTTTINVPYTPINEVLKRLSKKDLDYINRGKNLSNQPQQYTAQEESSLSEQNNFDLDLDFESGDVDDTPSPRRRKRLIPESRLKSTLNGNYWNQ